MIRDCDSSGPPPCTHNFAWRSVTGEIYCPMCRKNPYEPTKLVRCPTCKGAGVVPV